jgi:hypothetical protein
MKKFIFIFLLCIAHQYMQAISIADNKNLLPTAKWGEWLERPSPWSYGGLFGLNFVRDGFVFSVQSMVTYKVSGGLYIGASVGFSYVQQKENIFNTNKQAYEKFTISGTYYDYSIFSRWFFHGLKFIQIEPGYVNFKQIDNFRFDAVQNKVIIESQRKNIPYIQAGAGFVVPFAEEKFFIMRVMYDVLQNKESPYYGLPVIRGGVNIGI